MHNFRRLEVWRRAVDLAVRCYRETEHFPPSEIYGLSQQLRRASVSIASNVAEGSQAASNREFARYLRIAFGSACEVETQLRIALQLGFGRPASVSELITDVDRVRGMLHGLLRSSKAG